MADYKKFNSLDNGSIVKQTDDTGMASMFEKDGYIDYAKGNDVDNWKDYNSSDSYKTYTLNTKINPTNGFSDLVKLDNSTTPRRNLSIDDIVAYTQTKPQLKLSYQHFAYCSRLSYFPNNRLVVLRRFKGAVGDDLYQNPDNYNESDAGFGVLNPISTLVTWMKDDDDLFNGFNFGISHEKHTAGFVNTIKASYAEFTSGSDKSSEVGKSGGGWKDTLTNAALTSFTEMKDGETGNKIDGNSIGKFAANNPNMIGQGQKMTGLGFDVSFKLKFEYQMRYISGIDPTLAMLDILASALHMGTNESEFRYNMDLFLKSSDGSVANSFYKLKYNNTASVASGILSEKLTTLFAGLVKKTQDALKVVKDKAGKVIEKIADGTLMDDISKNVDNLQNNIAQHIFDRYREELKAAISVDTGLPSGSWHIMIGDPKNPFLSMGDLVVDSASKVEFGKELGPSGFPTSFSITYNLTPARPRGRQEIMKIFNGGRGRVYTYKASTDNPDFAPSALRSKQIYKAQEDEKQSKIKIANNIKEGDKLDKFKK